MEYCYDCDAELMFTGDMGDGCVEFECTRCHEILLSNVFDVDNDDGAYPEVEEIIRREKAKR